MQASRFHTFLNNIMQTINEVDVQTVKQKIDTNETFHLIDVREGSEWEQGHLPNAIHISKGFLECKIEQAVTDPDAQIILYCGGGIRSAIATDNLQRMGYTNVFSMAGGFRAWAETGFSVL